MTETTTTRRLGGVDLVLSGAVTRSTRLHWHIKAQRRRSKAMDRHISPDPWGMAEPVRDFWRTSAMSGEERQAAGRVLAERRWLP